MLSLKYLLCIRTRLRTESGFLLNVEKAMKGKDPDFEEERATGLWAALTQIGSEWLVVLDKAWQITHRGMGYSQVINCMRKER